MGYQGIMKFAFLRHALSLLLLVGLLVAGHRYLSLQLMIKAWSRFSWGTIGVLAVLPIFYLLLKGWRFVLLLHTVDDDLPAFTVLKGYAASQSASLLPGGFAMRSAIMGQAGVPVERSVGPVLANAGMDQLVLLTLGLFLAFWYEAIRPAALTLTAILAVAIVLMAVSTTRKFIADKLLRVAEHFDQKKKMEEFLQACWSMLDFRLFCSTFALSLAADAISYGILCLVIASLGMTVEFWPLAAAFVIPTLLGRLSPLPAGAGVTEAGMIAFMANQTAMSIDQAAAATALMRIFDVVLPALYGAAIYFFAWKGKEETEEPAVALAS